MKRTLIRYLSEYKTICKSELIYRATVDGFECADFHKKCENVPNTVSIIRSSNGNVFGGFTTQTWDCTKNYKSDDDAFMFSLVNQYNRPQKMFIKPEKSKYAIRCNSKYGPSFGYNDIVNLYDSIADYEYTSNVGETYNYIGTVDSENYLADSREFSVNEIEVYAYTFC
jgi:hypothetical protein